MRYSLFFLLFLIACNNSRQYRPSPWDAHYDYVSEWKEQRAIVLKGNDYGVIDSTGKFVIPMSDWLFEHSDSGIIQVQKQGFFGAFDLNGKLIIPIRYDFPISFSNSNYAVLQSGSQYSIANRQGNIVVLDKDIKPEEIDFGQNDFFCFHRHSLAPVGTMDFQGNIIFEDSSIQIYDAKGSSLLVEKNGKLGLMDVSGKWLQPAIYTSHQYEPYRPTFIKNNNEYYWSPCKDGLCGLMDAKGTWKIPAQYPQILKNLAWGLFYTAEEDGVRIINLQNKTLAQIKGVKILQVLDKEQGWLETMYYGEVLYAKTKVGIADTMGNIIVPCEYEAAFENLRPESSAPAYVKDKEGYYFDVDINGKLSPRQERSQQSPCSRDFCVRPNNEGKKGIVNAAGKVVVGYEYDELYSLIQNLETPIVIARKANKYGVLRIDGSFVLPIEYDWIGRFRHGLATVMKEDFLGIINIKGEIVVPMQYKVFDDPKAKEPVKSTTNQLANRLSLLGFNDFLSVEKQGKRGVINATGDEIVPCIYDEMGFTNLYYNTFSIFDEQDADGLIRVKKEGMEGCINRNDELIIPLFYKSLRWENGFVSASNDGVHWALLDGNGKLLLPMEYEAISEYNTFNIINNQYIIAKKNGKYGMVGVNGEPLIPFLYRSLERTPLPHHWRVVPTDSYRAALLNSQGKNILPANYSFSRILNDTLMAIETPDNMAFANTQGKILKLIPNGNYISAEMDIFVVNMKDNSYHFYNAQLESIGNPPYSDWKRTDAPPYIKVKKGDVWEKLEGI